MTFNGTKLVVIRETVLSMSHLDCFSNSQNSRSGERLFSTFHQISRNSDLNLYTVCCRSRCIHTGDPLDLLPLSPAIVLDLLHTFAVRILLVQCYGPVVSSQAQQQGEDLNKEIMFACK